MGRTNRTGHDSTHRKYQKNGRGRKRFAAAVAVLVITALVVTGIILFTKYRRFSGYRVDSSIEMSNSEENTAYYLYGNGYLKCAGDGVTYFNSDGIIWSENYSMVQPVIDICNDYIAVADVGQRNVYIYDRGGFINRINLSRSITSVEVSKAGMIAVASSEGNINYIELRDRYGDEIMIQKSIFSSSGYLMDLSLSEDGSRLAAVFVSIDKGTLRSKVVFYDLSGDGRSTDIIVGTFDQYEAVLLTNVQFMDGDTVCAVGDTTWSLYTFPTGGAPELVYEDSSFDWEIQSLFFSDRHIGMVVEEPDAQTRYCIKVFDTEGYQELDLGTGMSFSQADFAGNNVVLYGSNECLVYSLAGVEKLYYSFEKHIEALKSADGRHFVYGTNAGTEFITLQ